MPSSRSAKSHYVHLFTPGAYPAATTNLMGAAMDKAWADFEPLPKNKGLARSLMASAIIEGIEANVREREVLVRKATVTLMAAIKIDPEALSGTGSCSSTRAINKRRADAARFRLP